MATRTGYTVPRHVRIWMRDGEENEKWPNPLNAGIAKKRSQCKIKTANMELKKARKLA